MMTILVGKFVNGVMKSTLSAKLIAQRCNNGLKEVKTSLPKDRSSIFEYQRPTKNFISKQPTLEDPFELQHVFVDNVKSMKGEKGLFAQKNVEIGQVLAYYAGILWNTTEEELLSTDFSTAQLYVTCILVKNVLL